MSDDYVDFRDNLGVRSARTDLSVAFYTPGLGDTLAVDPPMPMIYPRLSPERQPSRARRVVAIGVQGDHAWTYDLDTEVWTDLAFVAYGSNSVGFTPAGDVIAVIDQGRAWWVEGVGKILVDPTDPNYQTGQGFLDVAPYTHTVGQGDGVQTVETYTPLWLDDQIHGRVRFEVTDPGSGQVVRFLRWATDGDFRSGQQADADRVLVYQFSTGALRIAADRYTSVAPLIGVDATVGAVCAISLPGLFVEQPAFLPYAPPTPDTPDMPIIGRPAFWTPFEFARPSRA